MTAERSPDLTDMDEILELVVRSGDVDVPIIVSACRFSDINDVLSLATDCQLGRLSTHWLLAFDILSRSRTQHLGGDCHLSRSTMAHGRRSTSSLFRLCWGCQKCLL